jgi:hypothetical protein
LAGIKPGITLYPLQEVRGVCNVLSNVLIHAFATSWAQIYEILDWCCKCMYQNVAQNVANPPYF